MNLVATSKGVIIDRPASHLSRIISLDFRKCSSRSLSTKTLDGKGIGDECNASMHPILRHARTRSTPDHLEADREHLWHPYTSLKSPTPVLPVKSANGVEITLETGEKLLDGMSSWWAAVHGYNNPELNEAVKNQLNQMSHIMFGGLTHRPAVELAELLRYITPKQLEKVFFTDSGSVAVEVAIKMSLQYWRGKGLDGKSKICSLRGGYHGDTLGAMSVCDPDTGMHSTLFPPNQESMLPRQVFVSRPPCDLRYRIPKGNRSQQRCNGCICEGDENNDALASSIKELEETIQTNHEKIAALIVEPLVQGAGGMRFYDPSFLTRARQICDKYNVLLIFDEIATGFGRAGGNALFACEEAGVVPDILCIGKALTGGYMTFGAVLATSEVSEGVSSSPTNDGVALPLMHGPTFMGNPLACSVAVASTNILLRETDQQDGGKKRPYWLSRVNAIENHLRSGLADAHTLPGVADVRVRGAIGVIEMKHPLNGPKVTNRCVDLGVWLRPFGRLLYTMPPYVMTEKDILRVTDAMMQLAEDSTTSL